jgi:hypothetical protein
MYYKNAIIRALLLFCLICEFKCDSSSEKSEMQLRYDACYKLIQIKAGKENDHFRELSSELNQEEINNILQYTLFECYQNIVYYEAEDIDSKNINEIDVYKDDYAGLLNFQKWEDLLKSKDENKLQSSLINIQQAYRDIQSGAIKINRYQKKQPNPRNRKQNYDDNYRDQQDEQFNFPSDMERDFELFGINFSNLSPKLKNLIGISLIILIFVCVIAGLKWIQKIRGENDKNKKKKNKKDKKAKNN